MNLGANLTMSTRLRALKEQAQFKLYHSQALHVTSTTDLLPGLNDILDAFEALPLELVKYMTLLKEIDAKCVGEVPRATLLIQKFIKELHEPPLPSVGLSTDHEKPILSSKHENDTCALANDNLNKSSLQLENNAIKFPTASLPNDIDTDISHNTTGHPTQDMNIHASDVNNIAGSLYATRDKSKNDEVHDIVFLQSDSESLQSAIINRRKIITKIRSGISEIIPCLEEKMHVTLVAADMLAKHMRRINDDYQLVLDTNEIPQLIRVGPLNHPAMIMDSSGDTVSAVDRLVQAQRSESRREALAARKAHKDDHEETPRVAGTTQGSLSSTAVPVMTTPQTGRKRSRRDDIPEPKDSEELAAPLAGPSHPGAQKRKTQVRHNDHSAEVSGGRALEPTYCYCNQVSFGEMVGCDGDDCKREWFHLPCIGYKNPPKGKWYCDDCLSKNKKKR